MSKHFDVIVIGAGHAGTEAALAAARMQSQVLLITHSLETLGSMSCNPAIGGIGKGHLVKEIDAMGGIMARAADYAGIQFRTLNASKGAAVRATRAQADRQLYQKFIKKHLQQTENLYLFQQPVDDLIIQGNTIKGITTQSGLQFFANAVILTAGTFLAGKIHIGNNNYQAGRAGDPPAITLAHRLREIFPHYERLKTGTPPRIDSRTVNFQSLQEQPGDQPTPIFSYLGTPSDHPTQLPCHITHTNSTTHELIRAGIDSSPLYNGAIEGTGPRYCPSIEDKVIRFADKESHQIFIEPEGLNSIELYPNGISTSLPFILQEKVVHSIKGFENAHITRPGYAIEYDFFDPRQLKANLETLAIQGLFFAGQINGTTGYEEAAAQGLLAGINASIHSSQKLPPLTIERSQGYIGVMIDDLITLGTQEPYRMFTSRAEYRLSLREDNADQRLTPIAQQYQLITPQRWQIFNDKQQHVTRIKKQLEKTRPALKDIDQNLYQKIGNNPEQITLAQLMKRPEWSYQQITQITNNQGIPLIDTQLPNTLSDNPELQTQIEQQIHQQIEIQIKYQGYLERQQQEIERLKMRHNVTIPQHFNYQEISGLSSEIKQKLTTQRPTTIGEASRISGVTPAAISLLLITLKQQTRKTNKN